MMGPDASDMLTFVTDQMTAKLGLKHFGSVGAEAIMKELKQLVYRKVMQGWKASDLATEQKMAALHYLMFLKLKHCRCVKGCGCADGHKQWVDKTKGETTSPTISMESLFLTCLIDAMEEQCITTCDVLGVFMQMDIDELLHLKLVGEIAELLVKVEPTCAEFVTYENGKPVIYAELSKALYGTLQAAMLLWKDLTQFLISQLGFTVSPYNWCVVNKIINWVAC